MSADEIRKQARAILWAHGILADWYLYDYQKPIYDFVRKTRDPFFEATRRFGKTTTFLIKVQEDSRRSDGRVTRWCEPWKDQARKIVMPEMELIQDSCPSRLRARFYRTDSFYEFPKTGSRLYLLGVNEDRGESARGSFADEIVADELGSWTDPEYVLDEVLRPQLLTTGGSLAKMSTPPKDLGHFYYSDKAIAEAEGRFIQRDFDAIDTISEEEKNRFIQSMGGRYSPAVRRELYCEPVADPESLVIPEYDPNRHDVPDSLERPRFYDTYIGMDLGFHDHTGVLFAYFDFIRSTLVIEDELWLRGKNSKDITDLAKAKEKELWGDKKPELRIADNDIQQLYDMGTMCDYRVLPTQKDDRFAAINDLRLRFQGKKGSIEIKKRCSVLRNQLRVGLWNDRKSDFVRGQETGHLDLLSALIYLNRNIKVNKNPYPQNEGITFYSHHVSSQTTPSQIDTDGEQLRSIFRGT